MTLNIPDSSLSIKRASMAALDRLANRVNKEEKRGNICRHEFAAAPTVAANFAAGFTKGDRWLDTTTEDVYELVNAVAGTWKPTT